MTKIKGVNKNFSGDVGQISSNTFYSLTILINTLTADWLLPKLSKNAKCSSAKIRLPRSNKVDF